MAEPTCSQRFDFEYERVFGTGNIPKEDLQKIMFDDVQRFSTSPEDPTDDLQRGVDSLLLKEKDDVGKEETSHRK